MEDCSLVVNGEGIGQEQVAGQWWWQEGPNALQAGEAAVLDGIS